jgi:MtN3 and saliva related transmembrane protein
LQTGEAIGLLAGLFTTFSVVPQIIKIFKTKSARDISLVFNIMFVSGGLLWLTYGILDKLLPIILWNVLGVSFNVIMLVGKLYYSRNERPAVKPGDNRK